MVIAVLARRLRLPLAGQDVVINVAGGLRVREPAADLAIAAAIASSLLDAPVAPAVAMAGEIGLGGELRAVPQDGRRAAEAARLGFETCLLPPATADCNGVRAPAGIRRVETLNEALAWLLPHTASAGPTPQALSGAAGRSRQQSGEDDEWLSTIEPPVDGNRADEDDLWRSRLEKTMRRQGRRNLP